MEEKMNLDAATQFGRRKARETYGAPPPIADHQGGGQTSEVVIDLLRRTRLGLGLVFAVVVPGLGLLFAGSYLAAVVYAVLCAGALALSATAGAWYWFLAAFLIWAVNIGHTWDSLSE